jgi:hypothetical protein
MRRRALLALAATTVAGVAGCNGGSGPGTATGSSLAGTDGASTTRTTGGDPDLVRCRGDPVSVERSLTDEPGYDDGMEYLPRNDTVRFVRSVDGGGPASFGTTSFERWASGMATGAGVRRVRAATADRLDLATTAFRVDQGLPPASSPADPPVIRLLVWTRVEDGDAVRTPAASLARLSGAGPRSVHATVSLDGRRYARSVPVFAEHETVPPA